MESQYVALISGLIGALIGTAGSVLTVWIQGHYKHKSDLEIEGLRLALEDWKVRMTLPKDGGGGALALPTFVQYYARLIELARKGDLTPGALEKIHEEHDRIVDVFHRYNQRHARSGSDEESGNSG